MPGKVIGLDLDGVVADYTAALRARVAAARGVDPDTLPEPTRWSFADSGWNLDNDSYLAAHTDAVADGMFATMPVKPGAVDALQRLSDDGAHIRIITHRLIVPGMHARAATDTVAWLDTVGVPYRDVCFIGDKATVDADVYVEDAPHNIAALRGAGRTVIVFDAAYNRDLPSPRAHNWDEAERLIRAQLHM